MRRNALIRLRPWCGRLSLALAAGVFAITMMAAFGAHHAEAQSVRPPSNAVTNATPSPDQGAAPGALGAPEAALGTRGSSSDSDLWRAVRVGEMFDTQKRGATAGMLVQSEGSVWQEMRDGPLSTVSLYALGGMLVVLVLFYLLRGRIMIDSGRSGHTIRRFGGIERFGHWLLASSFIVLGVTGLCMLYGRDALIPLIGKEAFATFMVYANLSHNYLAFAFMAGLALTFVLWVAHNIPSMNDVKWLMVGGGLFSKNVHPPARKFNAGQ
jgi:formate dehydrogenase subunit gamma